jgi:putative spermidine/putrescine transport system substrate-binding protein
VELFKLFCNGPANPAAAALIPAESRHLNCTTGQPAQTDHAQPRVVHDHYAVALEQYLTHVSK